MPKTAYQEKDFKLPQLQGISPKQLEAHLKLYSGYVTNVNKLLSSIEELEVDATQNGYLLAELRRRFSFEFNGMRLHEYYFESLGGDGQLSEATELGKAVATRYGSLSDWREHVLTLGMMRGIGWVITYYDPAINSLHTAWVNDHEVGHFAIYHHLYILGYGKEHYAVGLCNHIGQHR